MNKVKKIVGIKINERYSAETDNAEYVGYVVLDIGEKYAYQTMEIEDVDRISLEEFKEQLLDIIKTCHGKIPKNIKPLFEDCRQYPDLRSGYPNINVLLEDLGIIKIDENNNYPSEDMIPL